LLGELEPDRFVGLLHDHRAGRDSTALRHVVKAQTDQIASAQLAVDGEVGKREVTDSVRQLQPNPDCPYLLHFRRRFLAG